MAFLLPALIGLGLVLAMAGPLLAPSAAPPRPADGPAPAGDARAAPAQRGGPIRPDSPRVAGAPSRGEFWIDAPDAELADYLVSVMTPDELLGQLFMFGWPSEDASGTITAWIRQRCLGGVKVFGWNGVHAATLAKTLGDMQDMALSAPHGIPLFAATDQEGGPVRHIKDTTSTTPGAIAVGAAGQAWDAYETSRLIAQELRAMGVNMNFAPTVDVYLNPEASVIGARAFSSDPRQVGLLSLAYFKGMRDSRVIATAKHFPGHGNAAGDSHGMMPILRDNMETVWSRELLPYRMLIPEGLPAVLIGHLAFPAIAGDEMPASLNPALNRKLLRGKLGFGGIVITDDMYMGGASAYAASHGGAMSDIVVQAVRAGDDVVMMSRTPDFDDRLWLKIAEAFRSEPGFADLVRQSVRRILLVKLAYLKPADRVPFKPDVGAVARQVPQPGAAEYFSEQAARAVTVLKGAAIPFKPAPGQRIALIGQDGDFIRQGQALFPRAEPLYFPYEPFGRADAGTVAAAQALAARSDWVLFCLANPNSLQVLQALEPYKSKLIVISTLTPVYLERTPWVESAVAVYGQETPSFRFGFAAVTGAYKPGGSLPVRMAK